MPLPSSRKPMIHHSYESTTGTWQYIVADPETKYAAVIDPVLDFNSLELSVSTESAQGLLQIISTNGYKVAYLLETHAHADHLTAAAWLKAQLVKTQPDLKPTTAIGQRINLVQTEWAHRLGMPTSTLEGSFDHFFDDGEQFTIGDLPASVMHLPGHTPDHIGYVIGSDVFTGDSIFNPDLGSARCDFPGGVASALYESTRKLLSLPPHFRLHTGHDYPPATRSGGQFELDFATVAEHRAENKHVRDEVTKDEFVKMREQRDETLSNPKLLFYALQVNIRGGRLPVPNERGEVFLKVPLKRIPTGM